MTPSDRRFAEARLADRLRRPDLFNDAVTDAERKERVRAVCLERDPAIAGRGPDRKPETYAVFFERVYGEPLEAGRGKSGSRQ